MPDRKRTLWPPWLTAAPILLPILYFASFGPWLALQIKVDPSRIFAVRFLRRGWWMINEAPNAIAIPYIEYVRLWIDLPALRCTLKQRREPGWSPDPAF